MDDDATVAVAGAGAVPSPTAAPPVSTGALPGDLLLDPVSLLAVAVLVLNDHWLKPRLGADPRLGLVTGKLSDVAGLVFFPLVLVSLLELGRSLAKTGSTGSRTAAGAAGRAWATRATWTTTRRELAGAVAVVGVGFAASKVLPVAADIYTGSLAVLRWLPAGLAAALTGAPSPPLPTIHHVMDVTDCLSLPALWWSYRIGVRRSSTRRGQP